MPLIPCAPKLLNVVAERGFLPLQQRAASMPPPLRADPFKSSGARRGIREKTFSTENNCHTLNKRYFSANNSA